MRKTTATAIVCLAFAASSLSGPAQAATSSQTEVPSASAASLTDVRPVVVTKAAAKYKFKNCKALNKVYKHGVGKANAKDKTSGKPVRNFKKSTALYKKIVRYRPGLDRDKDGIACEKR